MAQTAVIEISILLDFRTPDDMIHTSPRTHSLLQQDYDEYGDSFTTDTTEEQLQKVFEKMNVCFGFASL